MGVTFVLAGRRMLPGGWKWTSLGASIRICVGWARHRLGPTPYALVNARVNASCEPYPASTAMSRMVSRVVTRR